MVNDELQDTRRRHGQLDLDAIADAIPSRPVPERASVAGEGVFGFALAQQILDGELRDFAELGWLQRGDILEGGNTHDWLRMGY